MENAAESMHSRLLLRPSEELNTILRGIIARGVPTAPDAPSLANLHDDPRWLSFLRRIGFAPGTAGGDRVRRDARIGRKRPE
ncbi:MAG: hypothetical protein K8J08_10840 [Thermoanaerobaculia bacterium]|nr:hypothetical protein [Thermoanaerobaculia bacterium]